MRGRELAGELGRLFTLVPRGLVTELLRLRVLRVDGCGSIEYGVARLVSEFWRDSPGNSSPKNP